MNEAHQGSHALEGYFQFNESRAKTAVFVSYTILVKDNYETQGWIPHPLFQMGSTEALLPRLEIGIRVPILLGCLVNKSAITKLLTTDFPTFLAKLLGY